MAESTQGAPYIDGQGNAWYFDSAIGELVPAAGHAALDNARSIGTASARFLVNRTIPHGTLIYTSAAAAAYGNATAETTIVGTKKAPGYVGAPTAGTLPAAYLNVVGRTTAFRTIGIIANTGTPNLTLTFKLGTTAIITTGVQATATITGTLPFEFSGTFFTVTTGATGTLLGHGAFRYYTTAPVAVTWSAYTAAAVTVDLTGTLAVDVTATWGTQSSSNTMTGQSTVVWA